MKGVSQIVIVILILFIGLSVTASYFAWVSGSLGSVTNATEQKFEQDILKSKACLKILSVDFSANSVKVWNCGSLTLNNPSIVIDGETKKSLADFLRPGDIKDLSWGVSIPSGSHTMQVTTDSAVAYKSASN